jgi:hypothetical protein
MEARVKINLVPKGLDDRDDTGRKRAPGHNFEVTGQGAEGAAAKMPQEPLLTTVRTADAGKPAAGVAAVEVALDHLPVDRPEKTVLPLETNLILCQEPVEMMEEHPVEDGPLRMSRTIDSRHGGRMVSKNGPSPWIRLRLPEKTGKAPARKAESGR